MQKIHGPNGLILEIDPTDAATPAIVELRNQTSTYDCAMDTGCVGCDEEIMLSAKQIAWLETKRDRVDQSFAAARNVNPDYT
jgi:hypothetical protein